MSGLPGLSAAMNIGGSVIGAFGALREGQYQKAMAGYDEEVANLNAQVAINKSIYERARHRTRLELLQGSQIAAMGENGFDVSSGSNLDVQYFTRKQGELDDLAIAYEGEMEAMNWRSKAELASFQGKAAVEASYWKAGSSLLTGSANAMNAYSYAKRPSPATS